MFTKNKFHQFIRYTHLSNHKSETYIVFEYEIKSAPFKVGFSLNIYVRAKSILSNAIDLQNLEFVILNICTP